MNLSIPDNMERLAFPSSELRDAAFREFRAKGRTQLFRYSTVEEISPAQIRRWQKFPKHIGSLKPHVKIMQRAKYHSLFILAYPRT